MKVFVISVVLALSCMADKTPTLTVAPLSRGTRGVDVELAAAIIRSCPAVTISNRIAEDYYLTWDLVYPVIGMRVSVVLYREPQGVAVASFTEHSVKSVAKDVCSAIARQ